MCIGSTAISPARVAKFLDNNKDTALYMGRYDRAFDFFTGKHDKLESLWNELHKEGTSQTTTSDYFPKENYSPEQIDEINEKIHIFSLIRDKYYTGEYKTFKVLLTQDSIEFMINLKTIKSIPFQTSKALGVKGQKINQTVIGYIKTQGLDYQIVNPLENNENAAKSAKIRQKFTKLEIEANRKAATWLYEVLLNLELKKIINRHEVNNDDRKKYVRLIIRYNQICNLVLRHGSNQAFSIEQLKEIAAPIFTIFEFDEEQMNNFIDNTIWLNMHHNHSNLGKKLLKVLALPFALLAGLVLGPFMGAASLAVRGYYSVDSWCCDRIILGIAGAFIGILLGPLIGAEVFAKKIISINSGDDLAAYTKNFEKVIDNILNDFDKEFKAPIATELASMQDLVDYAQIVKKDFFEFCKQNLEQIANGQDLTLKSDFKNKNKSEDNNYLDWLFSVYGLLGARTQA